MRAVRERRRTHRMASYALLGGAVLVIGVGGCCLPSEDALARKFHRNRATLETILAMAQEDQDVIRIAPDFTWLAGEMSWPRPEEQLGFSRERWQRYRQLFEEAGVPAGVSRRDTKVFFLVESCGIVGSGRTNGYVHAATPPSPILEDLDELQAEGIGYVPLEGDWYLFAERD